jgi:hypothetical protein
MKWALRVNGTAALLNLLAFLWWGYPWSGAAWALSLLWTFYLGGMRLVQVRHNERSSTWTSRT